MITMPNADSHVERVLQEDNTELVSNVLTHACVQTLPLPCWLNARCFAAQAYEFVSAVAFERHLPHSHTHATHTLSWMRRRVSSRGQAALRLNRLLAHPLLATNPTPLHWQYTAENLS